MSMLEKLGKKLNRKLVLLNWFRSEIPVLYLKRVADLRRTSGFRISVLFFVTFSIASLALCLFLYLQTKRYTRSAAFEWVRWESNRLSRLSPSSLRERTDASRDFEQGGRPLSVYSPDGWKLAGADIEFPAAQSLGKPFRLRREINGSSVEFFAMMHRLPSGNILLVGRSAKDLQDLEYAFVRTFSWGIIAIVIFGLIAAFVFGFASLRQLEAITISAEKIMKGDLSGRLPTKNISGDFLHLANVINEMLDQLERLMIEVKSVNENVAHDLRTPLTRVLASLERSLRSARSITAYREVNEEAIIDLKKIISRFAGLLRISEMEDRLRRSHFRNVDLASLLEDVVDYYEPLSGEKSITMMWARPKVPIFIEGDASLLFEAASNLLDNAVKFTPEGGCIQIQANRDPIGFWITDTGAGVPPDQIDLLRRRFQKGSNPQLYTGFGIGLSLVDSIARLHSMKFTIEQVKNGCRVSLFK